MAFSEKKDKGANPLLRYCPQCDSFTERDKEHKCESCSSLGIFDLGWHPIPGASKEDNDKLWEMANDSEETQVILSSEWNSMSSSERESRLNPARDDAIAFLNYYDDVLARSEKDNPVQNPEE